MRYLFIVLLFASCGMVKTRPADMFQGDSGYVSQKQFWTYALEQKLYDTVGMKKAMHALADDDTIVKYYRYQDGYIACMMDLTVYNTSLVLFETGADGRVKNKAAYNDCSWCMCGKLSESFMKMEDFYSVRVCDNGCMSGATRLYIFKAPGPQDEKNVIYEQKRKRVWLKGTYGNLHLSAMRLDGQVLHTEYVQLEDDSDKPAPGKKMGSFKLDFSYTDGAWLPNDTALYNERIRDFY